MADKPVAVALISHITQPEQPENTTLIALSAELVPGAVNAHSHIGSFCTRINRQFRHQTVDTADRMYSFSVHVLLYKHSALPLQGGPNLPCN